MSGVLPYREDGTVAGERDEALAAVLRTLTERLEATGFTPDDVVKATVFLTDLDWLPALNEAWAAAFAEPRPARSAVQVVRLPRGAPIEVEAIVERGEG